jgi:hypothetical protein
LRDSFEQGGTPFILKPPNLSLNLSLSLFSLSFSLISPFYKTTFYMTLTLLYFPFLCDPLQGPLPIPLYTFNTGSNFYRTGKTWPLCLACLCVLVWPFSPSVFLSLSLPPTLWPSGPGESGLWLSRLEISIYYPRFIFPVLQVFSWGSPRKNFLTPALGNHHSKIPSDSPLGVFYTTLLNWT